MAAGLQEACWCAPCVARRPKGGTADRTWTTTCLPTRGSGPFNAQCARTEPLSRATLSGTSARSTSKRQTTCAEDRRTTKNSAPRSCCTETPRRSRPDRTMTRRCRTLGASRRTRRRRPAGPCGRTILPSDCTCASKTTRKCPWQRPSRNLASECACRPAESSARRAGRR